jgi:hypothetical protein
MYSSFWKIAQTSPKPNPAPATPEVPAQEPGSTPAQEPGPEEIPIPPVFPTA